MICFVCFIDAGIFCVLQVAERHDAMLKLKDDAKELEEKHLEALGTISHRGEVIKQLRAEVKDNNTKVS